MTAAKAHTIVFIAESFINEVASSNPKLKDTLSKVCSLYNLSQINLHMQVLLEEGIEYVVLLNSPGLMNGIHAELIRDTIRSLCKKVRKEAVPLVDAFAIPDICLGPLGKYDGNIYKHYMDTVKKATPPHRATPSYWGTLVKPILFSKL